MTTVRIADVEHQRRRTHQMRSPSHLVVLADPDNNVTPIPDAGDWTRHEITARVPGDSDAVVLGIFLAAGGQIELRNPELIRRSPQA